MAAVFTINFRREAYQRELARSRARVISLGVWLSYFGTLVVIFGLYGLNCATVMQRTKLVQRQAQIQRSTQSKQVDWAHHPAELGMIERGVIDTRRWRDRLYQLAAAMPANTRLTSIEFNPSGVSGGADWNRLLLTGVLRAEPNEDRMKGVTRVVGILQRDSVLSRHFHSIRLASTRINGTAGTSADFVIECRP